MSDLDKEARDRLLRRLDDLADGLDSYNRRLDARTVRDAAAEIRKTK